VPPLRSLGPEALRDRLLERQEEREAVADCDTRVPSLRVEPRGHPPPSVTDGCLLAGSHTFCTKESFDAVARAVSEYAFITTELPVILSLEVN
jgi:hypothetical protein